VCDASTKSRLIFFFLFVQSLFIGVITMGMFESFQEMKAEIKVEKYHERIKKNNSGAESDLTKMLRAALIDDPNKKVSKVLGSISVRKLYCPSSLLSLCNILYLLKVAEETSLRIVLERTRKWCKKQRDSTWLSTLVTATIIIVGVMIGVETDQLLSCNRYNNRDNRPPGIIERCEVTFESTFMEIASLVIFAGEALMKILAHGDEPWLYLEDPWNCLDAFVVLTSFVELTPARVIFEIFPVVVLRLLRLLRVFRLAKALPRLRSIVEALMEGFSAVGYRYTNFA